MRHQGGSPLGDFYDDNPISEARVMAALRRRGVLGRVAPEDLVELDQDHYGGPAAVETLARRAGVGAGSRVLDVCAGLGGPARVLAHRRGCRLVGCELHHARAAGAARLSRLVGLEARVTMVRGDARTLPFRSASFDACVSQEGLLHIDDKAAVLGECHRVLVDGGRLAFTDWIAHPRLGERERERLWRWMAATTLQGLEGYRRLLGHAGFRAIEAEDVSLEWRVVLRGRLAKLRAARADPAVDRARRDEYGQLFAFLVGLVDDGKLGGGRFTATR